MRAWALIGNSDKVPSTRRRAEEAIAKLPPHAPTQGAFSISLADDPPYTATSLLFLDEAYAAGSVALETPRLVWPVTVLAGKLDQKLMRDFTDTTEACAYHERYVAAMQQNPSVGGPPARSNAPSS
jgi:hypothetical protein